MPPINGFQTLLAPLDAGADDYLVQPFDLDELDARLRARFSDNERTPDNAGAFELLEY